MAIADNRQRYMPLPDDREPGRGQALAYPEAVLLVNPVEPDFKGEVFHFLKLTLIFFNFINSFFFITPKTRRKLKKFLKHHKFISFYSALYFFI